MRSRSMVLAFLAFALPLGALTAQRSDRSGVQTLTRSLSIGDARSLGVSVVDSAALRARAMSASMDLDAAAAVAAAAPPRPAERPRSPILLGGVTLDGRPRPTEPRPRFDSLAQRFYADDARMETLVAVGPTLAMVWLDRDSSSTTADDELPFRIFGRHPDSSRTMSLIPVIDRRAGLRYNAAGARYEGEVLVGFRDSLAPGGVITLRRPLVIGVGGTIESVDPARLVIVRINEVDTRVRLTSLYRPSNPVLVLHPDFSDRAVHIPLQVMLDSLFISAPRSMRGLGTQEEEIIVSVPPGSLGPGDSLEVTLNADKGSLTPSRVAYVKQNFSARVRLRSSGLGVEALRIQSGFMAADLVSIQYTLPWVLLLIALAGATLGTLMRWRRDRVKDPRAPIPWTRVVIAMLVVAALSVGLEKVGMGYALGFSEAGTFVMAAIFAGGVSVLRWKDATT